MFHGSHFELQNVGSRYTFGIAPIEFVDLILNSKMSVQDTNWELSPLNLLTSQMYL